MRLPAARIDALIWALIYVGMVLAALGVALQRDGAAFGWGLVGVGTAMVAAGIVLICIRSRINSDR